MRNQIGISHHYGCFTNAVQPRKITAVWIAARIATASLAITIRILTLAFPYWHRCRGGGFDATLHTHAPFRWAWKEEPRESHGSS